MLVHQRQLRDLGSIYTHNLGHLLYCPLFYVISLLIFQLWWLSQIFSSDFSTSTCEVFSVLATMNSTNKGLPSGKKNKNKNTHTQKQENDPVSYLFSECQLPSNFFLFFPLQCLQVVVWRVGGAVCFLSRGYNCHLQEVWSNMSYSALTRSRTPNKRQK